MIDIALLRTDPELVRRTVEQRGTDVEVERLLEVDAELRQAIARSTVTRAQQRRRAMSREPLDAQAVQALHDEVRAAAEQARSLQELRDELWARVPNLAAADTPACDVELRSAGDPVAAADARSHLTVGPSLGILALAKGTGPGGYYWRGDGARLAWAVLTHAQHVLHSRGCIPTLASQDMISYYGDQILDGATLPIRLSAFAVPYTLEQIVVCRPEDSAQWLDECQRNTETILDDLELPYRVVRVCLGELAAAAHKAYGTQTWLPGSGGFHPTYSAADLTDYQARTLKIRYLDQGRVAQPHTLSATAVTDRAALAILENHVQPDGSVRIPAALRPYLGGQELITPESGATAP